MWFNKPKVARLIHERINEPFGEFMDQNPNSKKIEPNPKKSYSGALYLSNSATFPLFKAYPSLRKTLHRFEIIKDSTPISPLAQLEQTLGLHFSKSRLWIKRDDRSDFLLGGNKARKLEFLLADAAQKNAQALITAGMFGSNHALATALAAHELGLKSHLILGPQPISENVKTKLLTYHALGAELRHHSNLFDMGVSLLKEITWRRMMAHQKNYYIPPGGSNVLGSVGYVNAFFELLEQVSATEFPEQIIVPLGSGGTAAGLMVGACLSGMWGKTKIHAVRVVSSFLYQDRKLRADARLLYRFLVNKMDKEDRARVPQCPLFDDPEEIVISGDYFAPSYGEAKDNVHETIQLVHESEKIALEPTYSGKAMCYLVDQITSLKLQNKPIPKTLFWLTYNNHPLDKIIENYPWSDPLNPWRDLPKPFHPVFTTLAKR